MRSLTNDNRPEHPAVVARVDPWDGATQVLRDAPVVLRLSTPIDPASLTTEAVRVHDPDGPIPGSLKISSDLHVLIWGAERDFRAGATHFVLAQGLRDVRGRPVEPHCSRFVPCDLAREDLRI